MNLSYTINFCENKKILKIINFVLHICLMMLSPKCMDQNECFTFKVTHFADQFLVHDDEMLEIISTWGTAPFDHFIIVVSNPRTMFVYIYSSCNVQILSIFCENIILHICIALFFRRKIWFFKRDRNF